MLPQYSLVSVEEVIHRIKQDFRLTDTSEHDSQFEILIREGLGSIGAINQLQKKQCPIVVEDCNVKLPSDLVKFIALGASWTTTNTNGVESTHCGRFQYADLDFLNSCGCSTNGFTDYRQSIQINKGYIHFNSDSVITNGIIAYMGMWQDENGKNVIFERFERALTAYACWKFTRSWQEKYNQYTQESYRAEWVAQREKMRGMAVADDFDLNKREISQLMRGFLVSPITLY